jgi:tetratricopeptide (TPR) repeat protein
MSHHPTEEELAEFLAARLDPVDQRRVVRHFLAGCAACSRVIGLLQGRGSLAALAPAAAREREPQRAEDRKLASVLEALRVASEAPGASGLQPIPPLQGRELVEALLHRSFALRFTDSRAMEGLAYRALRAAEGLGVEGHARTVVCDLQAQVWAELANAFRINERYEAAEAGFRQARALLHQGTGDLGLLAHLTGLQATLCIAQRRLTRARELLSGAYLLSVRLGDRRRTGQTLIARGTTFHYEGKFSRSAKLYQKALGLLHEDRDADLVLIGLECHFVSLVGSGDYREAGELLLRSDLRQAFANRPLGLSRIRWAEGNLLAGLGKTSKATRILSEVRSQFDERELPCNAAMVGLDLLPLLQRQGKIREVRETARKSYTTLRDLKIFPDAAKAKPYLA